MTRTEERIITIRHNPDTENVLVEASGFLTRPEMVQTVFSGVIGMFWQITNNDQEKFDYVVDQFVDALKNKPDLEVRNLSMLEDNEDNREPTTIAYKGNYRLVSCCYNCAHSDDVEVGDGLSCFKRRAFVDPNGLCDEHE